MLVLVAKFTVQAGRGDEVAAALAEMAAEVQANEPGCHAYYVNRSNDNPDYFLIYEQYDDEAALEVHRQAAHFKAIVEGRVVPLLEKREREFYSLVA